MYSGSPVIQLSLALARKYIISEQLSSHNNTIVIKEIQTRLAGHNSARTRGFLALQRETC